MKKLILFIMPAAFIAACNGSADKASINNKEIDTPVATAPVPGTGTQTLSPDAVSRAAAPSGEDERVKILSHIYQYLVPKANIPAGSGIKNATVTLENTLDDVTFQKVFLEVKVIGKDGSEIRTDYLTFQNIEPGDIKTQRIANAAKGDTVQCKVIKLKSDSLTRGEMILVGEHFTN